MKNIAYFSRIRAISCLAIVFLHTFFLAASGFETSVVQQTISMMVRNSLLWAVPCFVMVSGALLLDPERYLTLAKVAKKYLWRILLAILLGTLVFCLFDRLVKGEPQGISFWTDYLIKLWTNESWPHMWYLYMLVGLYLMVPLYRLVTRSGNDMLLKYALGIFFLFLSVLPSLAYLTGRASGFYLLSYTIYPFYFFMGYALHTKKLRLSSPAAWLLTILGTFCLMLVTYLSIRLENDSLRSMSSNYGFVAVVLQSVGIFSLFQKQGEREEVHTTNKLISAVDTHAFGIYLFHLLWINTIYRVLHINPYTTSAWGAMLVLLSVVVFFGAWGLTWLLKKIPGSDALL